MHSQAQMPVLLVAFLYFQDWAEAHPIFQGCWRCMMEVICIGREINRERRKLENPHYSLCRAKNSVFRTLLIHLGISWGHLLFQLKTLYLEGFPGFSPWPCQDCSSQLLSISPPFMRMPHQAVLSGWNESTPNVPFWRKSPLCSTSNPSTHTEAPRSRKVCVVQPSFML